MNQLESYTKAGEKIDKDIWRHLLPQLTEEQFKAAWKGANKDDKGIIWWRIGEGKTRIAIAWMLMQTNNPKPLIVCAPGAIRQWLDEIELLGFNIKPRFVSSGILSRSGTLLFDSRVNCIVIDELWMYKNPSSKRSKTVRQLTNRKPSIGLSGSLMTAGNLEDLYGQAKAMNLDKKLAISLTDFRTQFMIETESWAGFIKRYPQRHAVEQIQRRLIDNVSVYFPKERREIRDIPVNVDPTPEQLAIKRELVRNWQYEEIEVKGAAALLIKLQQVSDGWVRDSEGDFISVSTSKLIKLKELCSELFDAGEKQLLIWTGFRKTAKELSNALDYKTTVLAGDGKFDVFGWREGKVKITIATVGSGASLNDFANVRYSIFYSTSFSNLNLQQARGRTNRKSSLHNCAYYYFLSTNKFPDKDIYQGIEDNRSKEELVIDIARRVLKGED
jgi:hypothetical protein